MKKYKQELLKIDQPNKNGIIYMKEAIEKAIDKIDKSIFITLGNDNEGEGVPFNKIVAQIDKKDIKIEDNSLNVIYAKTNFLKTDVAQIAFGLLKEGTHYRLFPRGFGEVNSNKEIKNFEFQSIDIFPNE